MARIALMTHQPGNTILCLVENTLGYFTRNYNQKAGDEISYFIEEVEISKEKTKKISKEPNYFRNDSIVLHTHFIYRPWISASQTAMIQPATCVIPSVKGKQSLWTQGIGF